ncbi:hypothetical protein LUTEI9C_50208 [Luteimonas sp. 9C]|uniref:hypothetical protein n=1 Tax=Luteimonas sp. 9C TaxID=2653148 RepID=UPI0012F2E767|nr:hypothetical protein [Luteimonas sp. 9C]VXB73687.1 hypothetical protein LUTEI9C_50208 [Luteimonas sp. 9C]
MPDAPSRHSLGSESALGAGDPGNCAARNCRAASAHQAGYGDPTSARMPSWLAHPESPITPAKTMVCRIRILHLAFHVS